jgi:hypothetical protein
VSLLREKISMLGSRVGGEERNTFVQTRSADISLAGMDP